MLISRTPFRISFLGGGTDFEEYFKIYGGSVLSTTIDKYCYITLRRLPSMFVYKNQFTYSKIERFNDPDEVEHPVVREALKLIKADRVQINYDADLPARSGLGTSSSFAVGLLNALHCYKDEPVDKLTLAKEAIHLEHDLCREAGGMQDQLAVACGGFNRINFTSGGYEILPVDISVTRREDFSRHLMLFFTGFTHLSDVIAQDQTKNISARLSQLHQMKALVDDGERILRGTGNILEFGELLHHNWMLKRTLSNKIATDFVDDAYDRALKAGAVGGKLLGAGGGGYMLFFVEPGKREAVKKALSNLLYEPFKFEHEGTKIFYMGETDDE